MILSTYNQFTFLLCNFLAGVIAAGLFDIYRIMRRFHRTNRLLTFLQDILFLSLSAIIIFMFLLYTNDAFINTYVYVFMILGAIVYYKILSGLYIKIVSIIIELSIKFIRICKKNIVFVLENIFMSKK